MPRTIATTTDVEVAELLDFVRHRHRFILITGRADGSPAGLAGDRRSG